MIIQSKKSDPFVFSNFFNSKATNEVETISASCPEKSVGIFIANYMQFKSLFCLLSLLKGNRAPKL